MDQLFNREPQVYASFCRAALKIGKPKTKRLALATGQKPDLRKSSVLKKIAYNAGEFLKKGDFTTIQKQKQQSPLPTVKTHFLSSQKAHITF